MAAQALKKEITSRAADHLGCAPSEVILMDDKLVTMSMASLSKSNRWKRNS